MSLHKITLYVHNDTTHGFGQHANDPVHAVWKVYTEDLDHLVTLDPMKDIDEKVAQAIGEAVRRQQEQDQ